MPDYTDQNIVIAGAGSSGRGLARFFLSRGARVVLSDQRSAAEIGAVEDLAAAGVVFDFGGHRETLFTTADLVAVSPGVPLSVPAIHSALACGVPVLGEVEIAWREMTAPLIGITGTNGKSTVTTLLGAMFQSWGKRTFVGGNLGTPLIEARGQAWDWLVVELSSFQLEAIAGLRPRYALLLNLSEDHLDRYPDMSGYCAAKTRIFENMGPGDVAVANADDPLVVRAVAALRADLVWFSASEVPQQGMGLEGDELVWRWRGQEQRFAAGALKVSGRHNLENVMAALIPALHAGCPAEIAWAAATAFTGLPHRMELVGEHHGIRWFNDSKGTNVGSVVKCLAGFDAPVTLIAGGKDKQGDLTPLREPLTAKVEHLVLIGEAAERMARTLAGTTRIHRASSMEQAVALAERVTRPGGVVLLSPGCSSFDMFRNYQERGEQFVRAFKALAQGGVNRHGS